MTWENFNMILTFAVLGGVFLCLVATPYHPVSHVLASQT